jgi:hypothetical protein
MSVKSMKTINQLNQLQRILDFGHQYLYAQSVEPEKLRESKKIFYAMFIAAHNFSESIYTLCLQDRTHGCEPLLRSLWENLIKAKFLYSNPKKHYLTLHMEGLIEERKKTKHAIEFHINHPDIITPLPYKNFINELKKKVKKTESYINRMKKKIDKHPPPHTFTLLEKAKFVDDHNKQKKRRSESLERLYFLIYRTNSSGTHINTLFLSNFFKSENGEVVILLSGDPQNTSMVVSICLFLYKEILRQFSKIFRGNPLRKSLKEFLEKT